MSAYISCKAFARLFAGILFLFLIAPAYAVDTDGDGLDDTVETNTGVYVSPANTGTDPNNADTDYDSIPDGLELATSRDPLVADRAVSAGGDHTSRSMIPAWFAGALTALARRR